ncbi:fasciclin domain-containing protein [Haoranjiania flava]|uniref:Fasciclin domain-containing protein n=1 Tax=Haoranjiania flava TaxID=1856322 RepID=A0AAE3IMB5_9BACT|nr:fasciclin domain-containing protein [Haoranjiania flava]MCU7694539.1 fasciclin domain-containing protein [Haoranjiania flava]
MKHLSYCITAFSFCLFIISGCNNSPEDTNNNSALPSSATQSEAGGQENVKDDVSQKDVVKIASENKDFSTLSAAVKQAGLVTTLSNAGPFTIFAPNNAAFDKLPKGTVDGLMKEDKKATLRDILEYHAYVGVMNRNLLQNGQTLNMVNGKNITVNIQDSVITLNNNAKIIATVPASNGVIHVIDNVLLPPENK